jgi:hypothetical protein
MVGIIARLRQIFAKSETKKSQQAHKVLVEWQSLYKDLQSHPLTQAKVINEQLLASTHEQLKRINERVDDIHERVKNLEENKKDFSVGIRRTPRVQKRIKRTQQLPPRTEPRVITIREARTKLSKAEILAKLLSSPNLSEQEKKIVEFIGSKHEAEATEIAKRFKISRSNASLKLNKMHNFNCLSKRLDGKTVFYRLKDE